MLCSRLDVCSNMPDIHIFVCKKVYLCKNKIRMCLVCLGGLR